VISQGASASGGPSTGYFGFLDDLGRVWPSFELSIRAVFDPGWLGVGVFVTVAALIAARAGVPRLPVFTVVLLVLSMGVVTVVFWSEPLLALSTQAHLTPAFRMALVVTLVVAPLVPLLLDRAWTGASRDSATTYEVTRFESLLRPRRRAAWAIVVVAAVGYPTMALVDGAPRFPTTPLGSTAQMCSSVVQHSVLSSIAFTAHGACETLEHVELRPPVHGPLVEPAPDPGDARTARLRRAS
jgi:hypothetical protein